MAWPHLVEPKHKHSQIGPDMEPPRQEKEGMTKTPEDVTSRQTSNKQGMAGNNWRGLPKTRGAGEMLWMAYAPGVKGIRTGISWGFS